jgi:hypothetical protein
MSSPAKQYALADLKRYQILWTVASTGAPLPRIDVVSAFDAASARRKIVTAVGGFTIGTRVRAAEITRDVLDRAVEWVNLNQPDLEPQDQPLGGPAWYTAVTAAVKEILALDAAADAAEGVP